MEYVRVRGVMEMFLFFFILLYEDKILIFDCKDVMDKLVAEKTEIERI
jgi:hypothetical protein